MQFGKSVELDKESFFEGVEEYSLKQKVDAIKVYGVKMNNGETRVAFDVEAATPLDLDEWKKLNSLFQQQYNIETLKESLLNYYDSLRKEGTEPYDEIIEADKKVFKYRNHHGDAR